MTLTYIMGLNIIKKLNTQAQQDVVKKDGHIQHKLEDKTNFRAIWIVQPKGLGDWYTS